MKERNYNLLGNISKKALIDRWKTIDGKRERDLVLKCLSKNEKLESLPFITKINGLYDLRGIIIDEKFQLRSVNLKNIDFSYSNLSYLILYHCSIDNVIFDMCDCTELLQYCCEFNNCTFIKSKFLNAGFGLHGGKYQNIVFKDSNLKGSIISSPVFTNTVFDNCKLNTVDFRASHYINVKFVGKIEDVWFRGESLYLEEQRKLKEMGHFLNPMIVDFSNAELWFPTFSDHCDLSKVILPNDGNHFILRNMKKVLLFIENDMNICEDNKEKKFLNEFLEMYKYHAVTQDMNIINKNNIVANSEYYFAIDSKAFSIKFIDKLLRYDNS